MLKILFAGTPECAVPALEKTAGTHIIAGILTAPPSAKGRSGALCPSPVAVATERLKADALYRYACFPVTGKYGRGYRSRTSPLGE